MVPDEAGMRDTAGGFRRGLSAPALLRVSLRHHWHGALNSLKKACRPLTNRGVDVPHAIMAASPSAVRAAGSLSPANLPCTVSRPRHRRVARQRTFKQRAAQPRTVCKAKPLAAPTRFAEPPLPNARQRPKRRHCVRTYATETPDLANAAHRPAKRPRRSHLEAPPEVLWDRWRQMEPRRKRRT